MTTVKGILMLNQTNFTMKETSARMTNFKAAILMLSCYSFYTGCAKSIVVNFAAAFSPFDTIVIQFNLLLRKRAINYLQNGV